MTDALKSSLHETVNLMTNEQDDDHSANALTIQTLQREIKDLKDIVMQLTRTQTPANQAPAAGLTGGAHMRALIVSLRRKDIETKQRCRIKWEDRTDSVLLND